MMAKPNRKAESNKTMEGEAAATQTVPALPHEIELQILLRLPVESLLRFKSVSKQWLSSISDPEFIKSHRHRAKPRYDTILCKHSDRSLYSLAHDGSVETFDGFVPTASDDGPMYMKHPDILGSCNGLVFGFTDYDEAYCWNPGTGKYVRVECPEALHCRDDRYYISGLGYDSSTGDYKAVVAMNYVSPPGSPPSDGYTYGQLVAYILSFKTRTWTQDDHRGGCPYSFFSNGVGTVLDGNPHWAVRSSASRLDNSSFVIFFDVVDDRFKELPAPPTATDSMISGLGVLGGRELCVFNRTPDSSTLEVWAMKEYGVRESWIPLFDIPLFSGYLMPLCFTSSDKVLLAVFRIHQFADPDLDEDGDLFLYDPKADATRKIMVPINSDYSSRCYRQGYTAFALEDSFDWIGDPTTAAPTVWYYKSLYSDVPHELD